MKTRFPIITPGRRPNENLNPELEVMLRQVSPKLNQMVQPTTESEAFEHAFDDEEPATAYQRELNAGNGEVRKF